MLHVILPLRKYFLNYKVNFFSLLASSGLDGDLHFWSILDAKFINTFEGNNLKNTFTPFTVHI